MDNDGTAIYPSESYGNDKRGGRGAVGGKIGVVCFTNVFILSFIAEHDTTLLMLKLPFQANNHVFFLLHSLSDRVICNW